MTGWKTWAYSLTISGALVMPVDAGPSGWSSFDTRELTWKTWPIDRPTPRLGEAPVVPEATPAPIFDPSAKAFQPSISVFRGPTDPGSSNSRFGGVDFGSSKLPDSAPTVPIDPPTPPSIRPVRTSATPPITHADAFLDFGTGSFSREQDLTAGDARSWFTGANVEHAFGGRPPDAAEQAEFSRKVLDEVNANFQASGIGPKITLDPNIKADHALSVVNGTATGEDPATSTIIGLTEVGGDGFSFLNHLGTAKDADELAVMLSRNITHELMHAFGVGSHPDQTGQYIDSAVAAPDLLTKDVARLSPEAVQRIISADASFNDGTSAYSQSYPDGNPNHCSSCRRAAQVRAAQTVPEPTTVAFWGLAGVAAVAYRRRRPAR